MRVTRKREHRNRALSQGANIIRPPRATGYAARPEHQFDIEAKLFAEYSAAFNRYYYADKSEKARLDAISRFNAYACAAGHPEEMIDPAGDWGRE